MTPPRPLLARLRELRTDEEQLQAAHRALDEAHAAKWPPALVEALGWAAAAHGLDERLPEPESKPKRGRPAKPKPADPVAPIPLDQGDVERLLKLTISNLASEKLEPAHVQQLLAAEEGGIDVRPAYVAHLRGRL